MPSFKDIFGTFSKKKNKNQALNFHHELHGYDNIRHHPAQYNPSLSHKHLPQPQSNAFSQRQLYTPHHTQLVQYQPQHQVITNQCMCQQCGLQLQQQQQQQQQQQSHMTYSPQHQLNQQVSQTQNYFVPLHQQQTQVQLTSPLHQNQQQPSFDCPMNGQNFASQPTQIQSHQPIIQCICQQCPHQQQLPQPQQQFHMQQQHLNPQYQSVPVNPPVQIVQASATCQFNSNQHQQQQMLNTLCNQQQLAQQQPQQLPMMQNSLQHQQAPTRPIHQQAMSQRLTPISHEVIPPLIQQQHQSTIKSQIQPFQCHTIQPQIYQQQKQQLQESQRVQSFHQQSQNQSYQSHSQPQLMMQQSDLEVDTHLDNQEFSRYANMQSLRAQSNQSKFQEHVYCNQKITEISLPPYDPPPSYETFIKNRKSCNVELSSQHMTYHSESLVWQRTKDYENLRNRFLPDNIQGAGNLEPSLTS